MKRWLMLLTMLGGVMLCAPPTGARAAGQGVLVPQPGLGAKFGSRDPFRCTSKAAPTTGLITPDMAGQYFVCQSERINHIGWLFLVANVRIEVGTALPPGNVADMMPTDMAADTPVQPIRGSFDSYLCRPLDGNATPGQNCAVRHETHASRHCYRTAFGEWNCMMMDTDAQQITDQPPPR